MEPIERELADRKDRRKRLAIELQTLEATPAPRKAAERTERSRRLAALSRQLDLLAWSITELEEIIAEGRNPPRIPRPSVEKRRRLSDDERKAVEAETRADLKKRYGELDEDVEVHVASVTGLDGRPEVHIAVRPNSMEDGGI